jgi:hypothetical protein
MICMPKTTNVSRIRNCVSWLMIALARWKKLTTIGPRTTVEELNLGPSHTRETSQQVPVPVAVNTRFFRLQQITMSRCKQQWNSQLKAVRLPLFKRTVTAIEPFDNSFCSRLLIITSKWKPKIAHGSQTGVVWYVWVDCTRSVAEPQC